MSDDTFVCLWNVKKEIDVGRFPIFILYMSKLIDIGQASLQKQIV